MFKYALGIAVALFCCNAAQATCTQPVNGAPADAMALTIYLTCQFAPLVSPSFSGTVGIGNGSPTYSLDVLRGGSSVARFAGTDTSYLLVDLSAQGAGGMVQNMLRFVNGTLPKWSLGDNQGNSDAFVLSAGTLLTTAPVLVATQSGNVGIGATAPLSKLQVVGDLTMGNAAASTAYAIHTATTSGTDNDYLALGGGGASNDTTRGAGIDLMGNEYNGGFALFGDVIISAGQASGGFGGSILFQTNPAGTAVNQMILTNAGELGIGTVTPATELTVAGDIRVGTAGTNGCIQNFAGTALAGTCSSDANLKTVVGNVSGVLNKLGSLELVKFYWNKKAAAAYHNSTSVLNTGFLAQSVEQKFPELVTLDKLGYRQLDYTTLSLYSIEAIKELKVLNDSQAAEITTLKTRLDDADRCSSQLEARVDAFVFPNMSKLQPANYKKTAEGAQNGIKAVNVASSNSVSALIEAVNELKATVASQQARIGVLERIQASSNDRHKRFVRLGDLGAGARLP